MAGEINRINPTVVEGAEDIHGAESFDADYSPLNRPSFSWRDNMAQSRRTLDEKQVGDMMRMRRMGRGRYDAETFNAPLSKEQVEKLQRKMSYAKGSRPPMRPVENRLAVGQRMKGSMASEGFSDVLGTLIPQPHFVGFEEMQREKMKNRDAKDAESCGNCGSALVMNAEGEHGCGCGTEMEAEETMLGSIGEGNDFGQMEAEEFGAERRYRYGNRYITRDSKGRFKKNVSVGRSLSADRRRKAKTVKGVGQGGKGDYGAEESVCDTCGSEGKNPNLVGGYCDGCVCSGCGDRPISGPSYSYCERCYEKNNPSHENWDRSDYWAEETMLGSIGEGNDFGQMEAEEFGVEMGVSYQLEVKDTMEGGWEHYGDYDDKQEAINAYYDIYLEYPEVRLIEIDDDDSVEVMDVIYSQRNFDLGAEGDVVDLTQEVLAKGGVRVGGMTASAIVLAIAGLSGYYYARR